MRSDEFDWCSGEVVFWDLESLDPAKPLKDQIQELKEDLVQVKFREGLVLDIGWYPEFSEEGSFVIRVVREADWEEPLFVERRPDIEGLLACVPRAVAAAETAVAKGR